MNDQQRDRALPEPQSIADASRFDAILIVGFGGPECLEDVMPFLENVTRGRNVPRSRLLEVAEHYNHFGGVSPINAQVRALIAALRPELDRHGIPLPIFWGNRNWHPMLDETVKEMADAGLNRALAVVLAAYSSYSSCRQYREDIERARTPVGSSAPRIDKVRVFYNHPEFVGANADRVRASLASFSAARRGSVHIAFTAHSIPASMAGNCAYEAQLRETCRLVAEEIGLRPDHWALVYQSRSGRPSDPWLEPDILDHLKDLKSRGAENVVIHPIGFLSDHMEVMYDLDEEARQLCDQIGLSMIRSQTVGTHPRFIGLVRELIAERIEIGEATSPRAIGDHGPSDHVCPETCCLPAARPDGKAHAT